MSKYFARCADQWLEPRARLHATDPVMTHWGTPLRQVSCTEPPKPAQGRADSCKFQSGKNMNAEVEDHVMTPASAHVHRGVSTYAKVFSHAGGKELDALMSQGDRSAVCGAIYASPPYNLNVPALPVSRLSVNLTRASVSGGVDGERHRSYEALRYSMFLVPAGVPTVWRKNAPSRHLNIYFHADALDDPVRGRSAIGHQQTVFNMQAAGIGQLADQLAAELGGAGLLKAEAVDSLARLLLVRLARRLHDPGKAPQPLSPKVLASLRDYVDANLSQRILVADLARQADLSPNHFAQAFSDHTRQSPHQFVLALRLDRATQLLQASKLKLVDVAHDCGFANQQHLSNAMRRHLGTTPGRYRRMHGPGQDPDQAPAVQGEPDER
jgi:AraC family transcriptional regulator